MTRRYAEGSTVPMARSVEEIRSAVLKNGAEQFATFEESGQISIAFRLNNLSVRFDLTIPDRGAEKFRLTPSRKWKRSEQDAYAQWEKECRRRLRALAVVIKAKFIAIDDGVTEFETEFLPYVVGPGNRTIAQHLAPQLEAAIEGKAWPRRIALPDPAESERIIEATGVTRE